MPDIQLRFNRDMLVLSSPIDAVLARQGIDSSRDREYLNLMEPDVVQDALKLELVAGAQCLVTTTEDITRARLAHVRMEADAGRLAQAALELANALKPQHVLAEIGPCGLPLDAASKASLNENKAQYADAARAFGGGAFDAFFLNGFTSLADLKCALMGVAQVSGKPVFASMTVGQGGAALPEDTIVKLQGKDASSSDDLGGGVMFGNYEIAEQVAAPPAQGSRRKTLDVLEWPETVATMAEFGAAVVGFETADPIESAVAYARQAADVAGLPVLAQLRVKAGAGAGRLDALTPAEDIRDYSQATMDRDAVKLFGAGVQFLRATGAATPAFTGALAATVQGLTVNRV